MAVDGVASNAVNAELARIDQDAIRLASLGPDAGQEPGQGFAQSFQNVLHQIDAKDHDASDKMAAVERGESDDLVGAMLASQDASLSFSMLMQVRNKVVGAVDELIKLQL